MLYGLNKPNARPEILASKLGRMYLNFDVVT